MTIAGDVADQLLVVDDDEQVRRLLGRMLAEAGYRFAEAPDARNARALLADEGFTLMLCDLQMPGESGLELLEHVVASHPDTAVVMVTGLDDRELAEAALELGAYGYIVKPFKRSEVLINVVNAIRRRDLQRAARLDQERLERMVEERTADLRSALHSLESTTEDLRRSREETIRRLSWAVEYRDEDTGGHIERMSEYCSLLGNRLGLDEDALRIASPMHDAGKIAVPDSILRKPGKLTAEERTVMEGHAEVGYRLLAGSGSELLELAATIALTHHEKFDGTGYPRGLAGVAIPVEGRIAAVADVFDALTSDRVYRPAFPIPVALEMMRSERERHFDPMVLDIFLQSLDEALVIRERHKRLPNAA